ncbi:hypothetical protein VTN77DRAFT_8904 [Rasamsonia byssochlamydoides]|uniref:uncharacterized protein n=1 Tax=Rasamsonia byssochlamydoides TaxID=89139 RepID=UPI003744A9C1
MAPGDEYSAVGGGGKLKLKGSKVKDGRVEKKKKKKEKITSSSSSLDHREGGEGIDDANATAVRHHGDEHDHECDRPSSREPEETVIYKTEAERRYEEQRRKRLNERLKREGVKTHKERVEELNRYLSKLSEHHDMPKIGPG